MMYSLAPNVHVAVVDGDVVLLDAARDRYACVAAGTAGAIRSGIPRLTWRDGPTESELADSGYLAPAAEPVAAPNVGTLPMPPEHDLHSLPADIPKLRLTDFGGAASAALAAAVSLSLQRPMHWLRPAYGTAVDEAECIAQARRFAEARLYLPKLSRCLPRSLALMRFLGRRGCPGQLVFGVRTHPFEAHCWVQVGGTVLNDTLSHVNWYTPIAWT